MLLFLNQYLTYNRLQDKLDMHPSDREKEKENEKGKGKEKPNVTPYLDQSLQNQHHYKVTYLDPNVSYTNTNIIPGSYQGYILGTNNYDNIRFAQNGQYAQNVHVQHATPITVPTPQKVQFRYHDQNLTPPFLVPTATTATTTHTYVPISEGTEIRRTVIPVHIDNQIPAKIVVNQPPTTPQNLIAHEPSSVNIQHSDEAYEILLREYERLYEKLSKQEQYSIELEYEIKRLSEQISNSSQTVKYEVPAFPNNQKTINKKYGLNVKQLHDRLLRLYRDMVEQYISRKKRQARAKFKTIFDEAKREISSTNTTQIVETMIKTNIKRK